MSEIAKKYELKEEQYKRMVNDGVIATTIPSYDRIYACFKEHLSKTTKAEAIYIAAQENKVSERTVYTAIAFLNK